MAYYDGSKLLSLKDINRETPEIYISTSNRSAGKTTYFNRKMVKDFLSDNSKKFALLYRYSYELPSCAEKFFTDIKELFFPNYIMTSKSCEKDTFHALYLTDITDEEKVYHCGYALPINKADNIKKCSHLLSDTTVMLFDEFQSETNTYCPEEVQKFQSIHTSLARGQGKQSRYLPVIMISNFASLLNPYYTALGISARLQIDTNYLRGDGWVLEQGFNEDASKAQKQSAFNRAFGDNTYNRFSSEKFYLNDNNAFVSKMSGKSTYLCSLKYKDKWISLKWYSEQGILYVSKSCDMSYPRRYACDVDSMTEDTTLIKGITGLVIRLRDAFDRGQIRFQDLNCKEAFFQIISY